MPDSLCGILGSATGIVTDDGGAHPASGLAAAAADIARALTDAGISTSEPVLVRVANRAADLSAIFGVWLAGGVVVPVHAAAAQATVVAVTVQTRARFSVAEGAVERIADEAPPSRVLLEGAAFVVFTSGSTGTPKGVVLPHRGLAAKLEVLQDLLKPTPTDTVVLPLQLIFIFGLWVSLLSLKAGARLDLVGKFTPTTLAPRLAEASVLATVPSMLRTLFGQGNVDAPRLRAILTGGEGLGAHLSGEIARQLPAAGVYDLYGLTETGSCDFCLPPQNAATGLNTIGRPTAGVAFRIAGGGDGPGELLIRTPFGMLGYLDAPDLTSAAYEDGHFRTGDVARRRPDGFVEIVGRLKEIVSRGGNKIAPAEIEHILCTHPAVSQALCAGVPDERLGEALHAGVVLRAGARANADELKDWCRARTERFKVPDAIHILDALPTGPTGKALRAGLRAIAQGAG